MKVLQKNENATITVYLSLILLMILSLIFTVIEGARISTAGVFAERALSTATDSILADFYGPLWEEYHLFGYDAEIDQALGKADQLEETLSEYMSYTLTPDKNLVQEKREGAMKLLEIALASVEVGELTRLMDYKGELFRNEAVEYMKYDMAADTVEKLLDQLSLLETPKKVSVIYEKKLEAEEKLAEIDRNILRLMELFDGLSTSNKGIRLDKKGRLQRNKYFIKMIYSGELTTDSVSINNNIIFQAGREHYSNPSVYLGVTQQRLKELEALTIQLKSIDEALRNASEEILSARSQLGAMGSSSSLSKEDKKHAKEIRQQIEGYRDTVSRLQSERAALTTQKQELLKAVQSDYHRLDTEIKEILPLLQEAIAIVGTITNSASEAASLIESFERKLSEEESSVEGNIIQELSKSLVQMKQYSEKSKTNSGYSAMRSILENNQKQLLIIRPLLNQCVSNENNENYSSCRQLLNSIVKQLKNYQVKELSLDYSTLVTEKIKEENPVEAVRDTIKSSLTELVINPAAISDNKLKEGRLPSTEAKLLKQGTESGALMTDFIEDYSVGGDTSQIQNILKCFTDTDSILEILNSSLNKASEYLLFREYMKEHFEAYPTSSQEDAVRKPSALSYEQEYLLYAKLSDRDNLSSLVGRLIFLRMSANFVTLLGDRVRGQEALAAATALVGFTGLPILISITKTVLLLIWAFTEALLDVCALMQGKEVPVLKRGVVLTFPEMFLINRNYLQSKVPMLEQNKLALSYQDYLYLFLLLQNNENLAYYSMDLIQENIILRYEDDFYFADCLYGFSVKAEFSTAAKFIVIPAIRNYMNHTALGYRFHYRMDNSY